MELGDTSECNMPQRANKGILINEKADFQAWESSLMNTTYGQDVGDENSILRHETVPKEEE